MKNKLVIVIVSVVVALLILITAGFIAGDLVIRNYFWEPVEMIGNSMLPTIKSNQILLVKKSNKTPQRGEISELEDSAGRKYVKRIIAIPGDKVQILNGQVSVNDKTITENYIEGSFTDGSVNVTLGPNEYFVLGDNRASGASYESRKTGPIKQSQILGVVTKINR